MTATALPKSARNRPTKLPTLAEAKELDATVKARAARVAGMPADEARKLFEQSVREAAPSAAVVASDLLGGLMAAGMLLVRRFYPDADHASFMVNLPRAGRRSGRFVQIPVPLAPAPAPTAAPAVPPADARGRAVAWWSEASSAVLQMHEAVLALLRERGEDSPLADMFREDVLGRLDGMLSALSSLFADLTPRTRSMIDPIGGRG